MSEFTKLGGYLIEGQPEVAHDNTLSGNGLEGSPLGLSEQVSEVNDLVYSNSGTWNGVSAKLDTTAFSDVSGSFLTAVPEGYATTGDLNDLVTSISETYQPTAGMTAYQSAGDYYSASNPSGFITGVDLTPYQLTADMTAYQPVGSYLTTADSANFYTIANPSGFISEVPAGTMNESAFEYDANDKISGYNGSAFAGGSDVPEGVMVESGLEYNAVQEISGYNGSAIAQYGAEKQFLVHDDTLVHLSNSAQFALGVNLSAVAQLLGVDETVLYNNLTGRPTTVGSYIDLSESPLNFTEIAIYLNGSTPTGSNNISNGYEKVPVEQLSSTNGLEFVKEFVGTVAGNTSTVHDMGCGYSGTSGTRWTKWYGYSYNVQNKTTDFNNSTHLNIWKVIGIGRKS